MPAHRDSRCRGTADCMCTAHGSTAEGGSAEGDGRTVTVNENSRSANQTGNEKSESQTDLARSSDSGIAGAETVARAVHGARAFCTTAARTATARHVAADRTRESTEMGQRKQAFGSYAGSWVRSGWPCTARSALLGSWRRTGTACGETDSERSAPGGRSAVREGKSGEFTQPCRTCRGCCSRRWSRLQGDKPECDHKRFSTQQRKSRTSTDGVLPVARRAAVTPATNTQNKQQGSAKGMARARVCIVQRAPRSLVADGVRLGALAGALLRAQAVTRAGLARRAVWAHTRQRKRP